jgi:LmbE family N-acetylglucosaminyl deacetylase
LLRFVLPPERREPLKLLCLGAHADDIEIGCGGTILRLANEIPELHVRWVVFSGSATVREAEARNSASAFLESIPEQQIEILNFRDGYFPFQGYDIKDHFEVIKRDFVPSFIMTHWQGDAHQDHRLIAELTYNTFRDQVILEYEIPKYESDLGSPNFFAPLSRTQVARKVSYISRYFVSQRKRAWFSEETFLAVARLRGIGCNAPEGLAEAFHCRKMLL